MKKIVVIGGGTGLSSMLMGMKRLEDVDLTAIVTVADDGGSTGRIRDIYNVPAVGDIRHVLCAMADEEDEGFFADLLNYRFEGNEDVGGHNLGNLIFLAMINTTGSFVGAIESISRVLNVKGNINLTGGEPLCCPFFFDILNEFKKDKELYSYSILTNGTLITDEIAKKISEYGPEYVQISLEGSRKTNDYIRGKNVYEQVTKAVKNLKKYNIYELNYEK